MFKQFFGGQVVNFSYFLRNICVFITFPIIQSFPGKETRISDIGPRAKKRTKQKPMPILTPPRFPPSFLFMLEKRLQNLIIMKNNFVKYLVPVIASLTCASHKIMVYLILVVEKHVTFLAWLWVFRVVLKNAVFNFGVKYHYFSFRYCKNTYNLGINIILIRETALWSLANHKESLWASGWCICVDVQCFACLLV